MRKQHSLVGYNQSRHLSHMIMAVVVCFAAVTWVGPVLAARETTDYVHYRLGVKYKNENKYDQAIAEFRKVLAAYPDHYRSYMHIAEIRRSQRRPRLAIFNLEKALTYNPGWGRAHKLLAEVFEEDRQYQKALREYQKYMGVCDPDERPAIQVKLDRLVAIVGGKTPEEVGSGGKSVQEKKPQPKAAEARDAATAAEREQKKPAVPAYEEEFKKGVLAYKEGVSSGDKEKFDEALSLFRKTLALKPGHSGAYYYAGLVRRRNGQNSMARVNFTNALDHPELGQNAHFYLGKIYGEENAYEDAIKHLKVYIGKSDYDIGKREAQSLVDKYQAILNAQTVDTIEVDVDAVGKEDFRGELAKIPPETKYAAVEVRDDSLLSMALLDTLSEPGQAMLAGVRAFEKGRFDQALEEFKKLLVKYPRGNVTVRAIYNMGVCYMRLQDYTKAENQFQQVLDRYPSHSVASRALLLKALTYLQRHELKRGESLTREFIQKYRSHRWVGKAYEKLGDAYVDLEEPRRAVDAYQEAAKQSKSSRDKVYANYQMGKAYFSIKNYKRGIESYQSAIAEGEKANVFERVPDSYYRIADYYYKLKKYDTALPLYNTASLKYPDHNDTPWGYFQVANIYKNKKMYDKAIEQYEKLRKKYPEDYWARQAEWKLEETVWENEYKSVLR